MNELQIFNNEEFGQIRTLDIDGEPWFILNSPFPCGHYRRLETVTLNGVRTILPYTFYYCSGLTYVQLSECIEGIGDNAFSDCKNLTNICIGKDVIRTKEEMRDYFIAHPEIKIEGGAFYKTPLDF